MKNKVFLFLSLLLLISPNLGGVVYGEDENWFDKISKIRAASSVKEDVERIFDSLVVEKTLNFTRNENVYYKNKYGKLFVIYSLGKCFERKDGYNLPQGTVIYLSFSSFESEPIKVSKLKLDLSKFVGKKEDDTPNWIFSNYDSGIIYTLFKKQRLTSMSIGLSKKQIEEYTCKKVE